MLIAFVNIVVEKVGVAGLWLSVMILVAVVIGAFYYGVFRAIGNAFRKHRWIRVSAISIVAIIFILMLGLAASSDIDHETRESASDEEARLIQEKETGHKIDNYDLEW